MIDTATVRGRRPPSRPDPRLAGHRRLLPGGGRGGQFGARDHVWKLALVLAAMMAVMFCLIFLEATSKDGVRAVTAEKRRRGEGFGHFGHTHGGDEGGKASAGSGVIAGGNEPVVGATLGGRPPRPPRLPEGDEVSSTEVVFWLLAIPGSSTSTLSRAVTAALETTTVLANATGLCAVRGESSPMLTGGCAIVPPPLRVAVSRPTAMFASEV